MALPLAPAGVRLALIASAALGLGAPSALAAAPETAITSGPPATATTREEATRPFVFSSPSPNPTTFECRLDAQPFEACQSPRSSPGVPSDGPHTFEVRATDGEGTDPTPATRSFTVAIPPETRIDGVTSEAEGTVVLLRFSSDDPTATYECAVDFGSYSPCSSPFRAAGLAAGSHEFAVRGRDPSLNVDPTPAGAQFFVASPRPAPSPPPVAPPSPFTSPFPPRIPTARPVTSGFQVVGEPVGSGGTISVSVTTRLAGTLKLSVATKGTPGRPFAKSERRLEATASGRSRGTQTTITLPLDRATRAQLQRSVRLSAVLTLTFTAPTLDEAVTVTKKVTLLAKPTFRRSGGGVTRPGGFGVERIRGTRGGDVLGGQSGNDRLFGLGGNDRLVGGTGNDTLNGGGGDDSLDGSDGDDRSFGGPGDDLIIEERFGDDTISGGPGNDWIVGGRGVDRISGGPGDDVIFGGSAPDTVDCGPGDDIVFVNLRSERAMVRGCEEILQEDNVVSRPCSDGGTDAAETLLGTDGSDTCRGGGGADDLEGAGGDDQLFGGDGDDRMFGRFGNDRMFGGAGNDEMEGGRGADLLDGGAGSDQLNGGLGNDTIRGGPGNDRVIARSGGRDRVNCGPGRDTAVGDRRDIFKNCERVRRA